MGINSSVDMINQQANEYQQLSLVLMIVAIIFAIGAIVLWFVLDISHSLKVVTGVGVNREIKKIREGSQTGVGRTKTVVNWSTSGLMKKDKTIEFGEKTTVLTDLEQYEATTILDQLDDKEKEALKEGFVIDEDIKITGTDKKI